MMAKLTPLKSAEAPAGTRNVHPRAPTRGRGILRYAALVDATEALLQESVLDDVGLYQIAERANVPPASVYHFFPTKEAAFLALTQRYLEGFSELRNAPVPAQYLASWQALAAWDQLQAMNYYNSHLPALKLLLGGFGGIETRQADRSYNERNAASLYQRFNYIFHMPFMRDSAKTFHITMQILDAVWTISYLKNGTITDEYYVESLSACIAYGRQFLPERIELREEYREAVERGEAIVIPGILSAMAE